MRFASGDEDLRRVLVEELGETLFTDFYKVEKVLEQRLAEWGNDDAEDDSADEDEGSESESKAKKGLPEKIKHKLLDATTWARDARLFEVATQLQAALGSQLFEDHNTFREQVAAWINLYRALGGGWSPAQSLAAAPAR